MVESRIGESDPNQSLVINATKKTEGFDLLSEEEKTTTVDFGIAVLSAVKERTGPNKKKVRTALKKVERINGQTGFALKFALMLLEEASLEDAYVRQFTDGVEQS
ncbi:hypothetical protein A2W70_05685 [Candidatus Curtissbacteria bacterium RIFCSPLOWO2_02_41_11]|uniref:Uncharacterized protein n=2 Tax=Candidatus Curtissiibacteriota TaxID=1752717 RepID=A0A1F5HP93_9BACT|nr:MAG: hypothetical protein UU56_C0002G0087 [Candidatus Curtissbacteria bacterium GW2011_GWA2_41_24]OGD89529.1 MAG: hypothetical protein A2Z54_03465 [Candidatus Curtissbacteria bacterium RIFCSPHIGHO2_02_39_8]OGE05964.1 MAG: hypothetical protein A2W70_05685 [Candidatus Curtissbacteria bacterium RIFCSPLOWO2_02_41_11]